MKPAREHATNNAQTYFVTSDTWERRALFRTETWARLFFQNLLAHRKAYLLHGFVLMPDHFHLLITPADALERAVQLIKGGFSYRAKKELASNAEIWQRGFADHRIRNAADYDKHLHYVHLNPVKKRLCATPAEFRYSSAYPGWKLDPVPQGLKPGSIDNGPDGTAKAVPFQGQGARAYAAEAMPSQNNSDFPGAVEVKPSQNNSDFSGAVEAGPFQGNSDRHGAAPAREPRAAVKEGS